MPTARSTSRDSSAALSSGDRHADVVDARVRRLAAQRGGSGGRNSISPRSDSDSRQWTGARRVEGGAAASAASSACRWAIAAGATRCARRVGCSPRASARTGRRRRTAQARERVAHGGLRQRQLAAGRGDRAAGVDRASTRSRLRSSWRKLIAAVREWRGFCLSIGRMPSPGLDCRARRSGCCRSSSRAAAARAPRPPAP